VNGGGVTNGPWLFYGKAGGGWVGSDDFTITRLTPLASVTASGDDDYDVIGSDGRHWRSGALL
jgi:outer membrane immunogenic protein